MSTIWVSFPYTFILFFGKTEKRALENRRREDGPKGRTKAERISTNEEFPEIVLKTNRKSNTEEQAEVDWSNLNHWEEENCHLQGNQNGRSNLDAFQHGECKVAI